MGLVEVEGIGGGRGVGWGGGVASNTRTGGI